MSNLVKYTLDADGKVRIPVGSAGKKQLTINKLNDEINNIPDTSSISVEIESKQGLLPPARVTPKNEYPFSTTMNQGWENTMMGVPLECNGFIPDYIDTTNLTPGDRVYIIDPKHDDTSKYVLSENKTWAYAGNYNDPEIGGVEGNDYSNIASEQGGMWLIRQNPKVDGTAVSFEMKRKESLKTTFGDAILKGLGNEGDMVLWSCNLSGTYVSTIKMTNGEHNLCAYVPLSSYSDLMQHKDVIKSKFGDSTGIFSVKNGQTDIEWIDGQEFGDSLDKISQKVEIYGGDAEGTQQVKSNLISNPCDHEIFLNNLVYDGEINSNDRIWLPNGGSPIYIIPQNFGSGFKWCQTRVSGSGRRPVTEYVADVCIKPGMAFWYDRRGTTPLTIKFQ